MTKVVCNASPIIGLSMLGLLNLLYEMFEVYIPKEVYNEIALAKEGFAKTFFLKPIGILGVLQRAKELKKIDKLKPCLDILRDNGFRISNKLYYDLLKKVDE